MSSAIANEDLSEPAGIPPVEVGTMLFTMVEPHAGRVVAYNDWYERDHQFGGATLGAHFFSNRRWVATRALKKLRFPASDGIIDDVSQGSFLATYWKEKGAEEEAEDWARGQWHWLNARGRISSDRDHVHTADYRLLSVTRQQQERVPLELALLHPFKGLLVTMISKPTDAQEGVVAQLEAIASETVVDNGVALLSTWEKTWPGGFRGEQVLVPTASKDEPVLLQMGFLREEPEHSWHAVRAYAARVESETEQEIRFASGFVPTVPGTTERLDEI
ncbi:hypothetical protein R4P64_31240 [Rhodococcus sp. IEGM 1366]|uniref:hypothetical protein n=1 Tax=Rhodococcus sp. IEGM 1366 TaxID=3082223 RepID=UPI0029555B35|nr:hypothetical protein [Rhodococcus sp. IEGM 1366]MDV8070997.1 hypothetical protein [Rhodococcus sp. IEGM 1366]